MYVEVMKVIVMDKFFKYKQFITEEIEFGSMMQQKICKGMMCLKEEDYERFWVTVGEKEARNALKRRRRNVILAMKGVRAMSMILM